MNSHQSSGFQCDEHLKLDHLSCHGSVIVRDYLETKHIHERSRILFDHHFNIQFQKSLDSLISVYQKKLFPQQSWLQEEVFGLLECNEDECQSCIQQREQAILYA